MLLDVLLLLFSPSAARCRSVSTATASASAFITLLIANGGHMTPSYVALNLGMFAFLIYLYSSSIEFLLFLI